ncbi:hypothetical protein O1D97_18945 [Marinomonas sp. 15G1-11]|uniref:DUF3251 domain-containing protein n=1 Tax=Marinomonas phaeophyticola TaxID=3004091 RepID=A0ABT4JZT8_9GAMM|nr:hypothetical protein [Marinomonas sp. 15G1-11]MCZ2723632.1 hypothetical protein [Marinomonas sp. 15G1-11]
MKKFGVTVICLLSLLGIGCAGNSLQHPSLESQTTQKEMTRSQLQIQLGQLADAIWLRTGEIIFVDATLPLTSGNSSTLDKIKEDLELKIQLARAKILAVNERVQQRYQGTVPSKTLELELISITLNGEMWLALDERKRLSIVKGEEKTWELMNSSNQSMSLPLVWSETGELFIEEQAVLTVTEWINESAFMTSIHWFNGEVRSQGRVNLTLRPSLR